MFILSKRRAPTPSRRGIFTGDLRFRYFLLAAAGLHLAVTLTIFSVGKYRLMPAQFAANGNGSFAYDGLFYQAELTELVAVFKNDGLIAWVKWPTQLHIRIYSIPFLLLSRWTSFNVLVIEPVNLIYYLAILILVFQLGKTVFDRRAGLLAATIVGLWPSFLLHTTQLLRDPLLITAFLLLMLSLAVILTQPLSRTRAILWGLTGSLSIVLIRIVRMPMWSVLWAIVGIFICLLIVSQLRERSASIAKIAFACLLVATLAITPRYQAHLRNQQRVKFDRVLIPEQTQKLPLPEQIAKRREAFGLQISEDGKVGKSEAGSDLNNDVKFNSLVDIVTYLPHAAIVGYLAPFPNMWVTKGKEVGLSGRLLSGMESILTYLIEALALVGLWVKRRTLLSWLLAAAIAVGVIGLGLVVTNMGALYRLRYPFWILIVILGAGGVDQLRKRLKARSDDGYDATSPGVVGASNSAGN